MFTKITVIGDSCFYLHENNNLAIGVLQLRDYWRRADGESGLDLL